MPSLWTRVNDIFTASSHARLDRIENPLHMGQQLLRDLDDDLHRLRRQLVCMLGRCKTLERETQRLEAQIAHRHDTARQAIAGGDENRAREQLARRLRLEKELETARRLLGEARQQVALQRRERDHLIREREELASQARLMALQGADEAIGQDLYSRTMRRRERMATYARGLQEGADSMSAAHALRDEELATATEDDSGALDAALDELRAELAAKDKA